jgi:hypothetical protein
LDKWAAPTYPIYGTTFEEEKIIKTILYQIPIFGRALFLQIPQASPLCTSGNITL